MADPIHPGDARRGQRRSRLSNHPIPDVDDIKHATPIDWLMSEATGSRYVRGPTIPPELASQLRLEPDGSARPGISQELTNSLSTPVQTAFPGEISEECHGEISWDEAELDDSLQTSAALTPDWLVACVLNANPTAPPPCGSTRVEGLAAANAGRIGRPHAGHRG